VFPLLNTQIQHDRVTIICGSPVRVDEGLERLAVGQAR
jgi:hypothetical protein